MVSKEKILCSIYFVTINRVMFMFKSNFGYIIFVLNDIRILQIVALWSLQLIYHLRIVRYK